MKGFITEKQLAESLEFFNNTTTDGVHVKFGEFLVQMGVVSEEQIKDALRIQSKAIIMACPACKKDFDVLDYDPTGRYACTNTVDGLPCGEQLVKMDSTAIIVHDTTQSFPADVREASAKADKHFGKYVLLKLIGSGGMGQVYKAYDSVLGRYVAIKIMALAENDEFVNRFLREANTAAGLKHPNIVTIYEAGVINERYFIAMEFVDGTTIDKAKLPIPKTLELFGSICDALEYAHKQGIVHRDIKPSNIMVSLDFKPFLLDFGLARQIEGKGGITASGDILGTPHYMSPEQADGSKSLDPRTDVYSSCATLYSLVCGIPPFVADSPLQIIKKVVSEDPVSPAFFNPKLHRDIAAVILKGMEKSPANRYQSAKELGEDLKNFLEGSPVNARHVPEIYRKARRLVRNKVFVALAIVALIAGALAFKSHMDSRKEFDTLAGEAEGLAAKEEFDSAISKLEVARGYNFDSDMVEQKLALYSRMKSDKEKRKRDEGERLLREKEQQAVLRDFEMRKEVQPLVDAGRKLIDESTYDLYRPKVDMSQTRSRLITAVDLLQKAAKYEKAHDAHFLMGRCYQIMGKYGEAESCYTKAIDIMPSYTEAIWARAMLCADTITRLKMYSNYSNENEGAQIAEYSKRLRADAARFQEALKNPGSGLDPQKYETERIYCDMLLKFSNQELYECIEESTKIAATTSNEHILKTRGDACYLAVLKTRESQWLSEAVKSYTRAIQLRANYVEALIMRAACYGVAQQFSESLDDVDLAASVLPDDGDIITTRGLVALKINRFSDAERDFTTAIQKGEFPLKFVAHNALGALSLREGDYKGAIPWFEESLKLKADYPPAIAGLAQAFYQLKDYKKSLDFFKKYRQVDPKGAARFDKTIEELRKLLNDFD